MLFFLHCVEPHSDSKTLFFISPKLLHVLNSQASYMLVKLQWKLGLKIKKSVLIF